MTRDRGRNRSRDNAYKRAQYKSESPWFRLSEPRANRAAALYDPLRDQPLQHADLTALLLGDPPIGRRAIDKVSA